MPRLDLPALQTQIAQRRLAALHLFIGTDVRQIEKMIDAVEATIDPADQPFALERVYAAEAGGLPVDIAASAQVLPMLGDRRIVIVLRAERLLKPKRAGKGETEDERETPEDAEESAVDMAPLEDYIARPSDHSTVLFVATEVDRGRRFTKRLVEAAHVTEFGGLQARTMSEREGLRRDFGAQLREELKRAGRPIDPQALKLLVDRTGTDISKARGDVERLLLYTEGRPSITLADVQEAVADDSDVDDWGVINAMGDGNLALALREAGKRLERGDSPHMMVGQLRWWVADKLAAGAPARVKPALDALLRTDLALKSSGGEERALIERLIVEITGPALPPRGRW